MSRGKGSFESGFGFGSGFDLGLRLVKLSLIPSHLKAEEKYPLQIDAHQYHASAPPIPPPTHQTSLPSSSTSSPPPSKSPY